MPKPAKKKAESSSDSDSGPDDRGPAKKAKASEDSSDKVWQLDNYKRISIREFRGKTFVDIREFYNKDGELFPGKKGITLSPALWKKLMENSQEITKALDAL